MGFWKRLRKFLVPACCERGQVDNDDECVAYGRPNDNGVTAAQPDDAVSMDEDTNFMENAEAACGNDSTNDSRPSGHGGLNNPDAVALCDECSPKVKGALLQAGRGSFEKVHVVAGFYPGEKTTYITAVPMRNKVTQPCTVSDESDESEDIQTASRMSPPEDADTINGDVNDGVRADSFGMADNDGYVSAPELSTQWYDSDFDVEPKNHDYPPPNTSCSSAESSGSSTLLADMNCTPPATEEDENGSRDADVMNTDHGNQQDLKSFTVDGCSDASTCMTTDKGQESL